MSDNVHIQGNVEIQPSQNPKQDTFLGMTKLQFLGLVLVLVFLNSISSTYSIAYAVRENAKRITTIRENAGRLEQDHVALCAFKLDITRRAGESERYLKMTPEEREAEFGPQLGSIPEATIKTSLANQNQTLDSLASLTCEEG